MSLIKKDPLEFEEQKRFVSWFYNKNEFNGKGKGYILFSIPNEGKRHNGNKFVETGLVSGIPDLQILFPSGKSLFIEMKRRKGKLNPSQKKVIPEIEKLGFTVLIGYGFLDAKSKFEDYLLQKVTSD